jgi:hypothetical protein
MPLSFISGDSKTSPAPEILVMIVLPHSFRWITEQLTARGMFVKQLPDLVLNGQYWIKVARTEEALGEALYRFD